MPPSYADVTNQAFDAANPSSPLYTGTQGREVVSWSVDRLSKRELTSS